MLSYEGVDLSKVNVILNSNDVSEYLKIAPSGLEVFGVSFVNSLPTWDNCNFMLNRLVVTLLRLRACVAPFKLTLAVGTMKS